MLTETNIGHNNRSCFTPLHPPRRPATATTGAHGWKPLLDTAQIIELQDPLSSSTVYRTHLRCRRLGLSGGSLSRGLSLVVGLGGSVALLDRSGRVVTFFFTVFLRGRCKAVRVPAKSQKPQIVHGLENKSCSSNHARSV